MFDRSEEQLTLKTNYFFKSSSFGSYNYVYVYMYFYLPMLCARLKLP